MYLPNSNSATQLSNGNAEQSATMNSNVKVSKSKHGNTPKQSKAKSKQRTSNQTTPAHIQNIATHSDAQQNGTC